MAFSLLLSESRRLSPTFLSSLAARLLRKMEESQESRAAGKSSDVSLLCWYGTYQQ